MTCPNCQNPIAEGEKFCGKCGGPLNFDQSVGALSIPQSGIGSSRKVIVIVVAAVCLILFTFVFMWFFTQDGNKESINGAPTDQTTQESAQISLKSEAKSTSANQDFSRDDPFKNVLADDVPRNYGAYFLDPKTPEILKAVINNEIDEVKKLLEGGADPNTETPRTDKGGLKGGETLLMFAAALNRVEMMELLLAKGASVEAKSNIGDTALIIGSSQGKAQAVSWLLEHGADVNAANKGGYTALIGASGINSSPEVVKILIKKGANLDAQNNQGVSALIISVLTGNLETSRVLLESGANVNLQSDAKMTAFDYAEVIHPSNRQQFLDLLRSYGGKPAKSL